MNPIAGDLAGGTELERRARLLDENNRQLHMQLAQTQQQLDLSRERAELMQRQLKDVSSQLQTSRVASARPISPAPISNDPGTVASRSVANATDSGFQRETTRKSSARLTANTSQRPTSEGLRELGYDVEVQGNVLRLRVPSDQLFQPSSAQLSPGASGILDRIADVVRAEYPRQRIAIEGHSDNAPLYGGSYTTAHQLTSAQTSTILEYLIRRNQLPGAQWFTLAHGSNYPIQDNQNPVGRAANRRIEFVVYPETF